MEKVGIRWEGAQLVNHSLAYVNREICLRLANLPDVELSLLPTEHDTLDGDSYPRADQVVSLYRAELPSVDFHIAHRWPPNFIRPPKGRWIVFQPWEYGPAPDAWLAPMLYEVDEIWVYSEYNRQTYIQSGVPAEKLFVLPLGIDPARHTAIGDRHSLKTSKTFKFLFVGGTIWRKGIDILLRAYVNTFTCSDDVTLIIKDFGADSFYGGQTNREMIERVAHQPNAPEIVYLDSELSEPAMASLYRACDCLVHPYRGEGFGLPILEAMACGLPVIIPNDGPAVEYTTPACAFQIPSTRVRMDQKFVGDIETVDHPQVIEMDEAVLCKTMRGVYENRDVAREVGLAASEHALRHFTWDATLRRLHDHLMSTATSGEAASPVDWAAEARTKLASGDTKTSAWLWQRVLKEDPADFEARFTLGTLCTLFRRHGEAVTHLTACLMQATDPALAQNLHYNLGLNQSALLQFSAAEQSFTKALAIGDSELIRGALTHARLEAARRRPASKNRLAPDSDQLLRIVAHAFEGSPDALRERRRQWVGLFRAGETVLDIGCGDGLFMELLRDHGVHSEGIDLDPVKVETARRKGLHVACTRAEDYFKDKVETYDGVFLGHIVEHLLPQDVLELLQQAVRTLKPGGRLVILTPNIRNEIVQENFWLDVTHVRPYPRLLMIEMLRAVGLEIAENGFLEDDHEYYVVGKAVAVPLVWESPIFNTSGYASEGKTHIEALRPLPYAVSLILRESTPRTDLYSDVFVRYAHGLMNNNHAAPLVHIQFVPGHYFVAPKAPISIGRTMFETDRIPEDWVYKCNQLSEVWAPSHFNRETFVASGVVSEKVRVIPSPLDFDFYRPQPGREAFRRANPELRRFVFLSIFDWNYRKGWDILLQAFAEEFHPEEEVSLLLKVSRLLRSDPTEEIQRHLRKMDRDINEVANIQIINSFLSETQVRELYTGSDAFVLPTRGEGWGRPYMEAMAMGLPTIGTRWGGSMEFMNDQNSFLIDIDGLETIEGEMEYPFYRGHQWARPSVPATRRQMRRVYENYRDARLLTEAARQDLVNKFSPACIAEQMHRRIQELVLEL